MLSEEEAIENLNNFKSISILYGNTFTMFLDQLKKYQESTDIVLNLITKLQKENKKKDKQIDLMAEKLAKTYHYKPRECSLKEKENIDCNKYNDCTSCVKQYFETKAKKGE